MWPMCLLGIKTQCSCRGSSAKPILAKRGSLPETLDLILILPDLETQIGRGPVPALGNVCALA